MRTFEKAFLPDKKGIHESFAQTNLPSYLPRLMQYEDVMLRQPSSHCEDRHSLVHRGWQSERWKEPWILNSLVEQANIPETSSSRLLEM